MRAKTLLAICAIALVSATYSLASEMDRKVQFTFDKPVSIPAVHKPGWGVLPPGTYTFTIMDSGSNRHIVRISNKADTETYATVLALPNTRLNATGKVVITFRETPAGQPFALQAMFYPGWAWGEEFVYPKTQAAVLAKATNEPVLSMPAAAEEAKPEAPKVVAALEAAPVTAVAPSGAEVQTAEVVTPPTAEQQLVAKNEPPKELPHTGSPLPLIALMGFMAMTAGMGLRFALKRVQR